MNKKYQNSEFVILGSGLAGLSTAYHLKRGYSLYEKETEPGGMSRTINKNGYRFDYDGHLLHFRNEYTFSLISKLLGGNLAPHKRNSWIYSKGSYTRYPFQANFYGLPKNVIRDCLVGLIKARCYSPQEYEKNKLNINFEDWIKKTFGSGIAEHFMLSYNRKFWTVDPKRLTCEWLDGFVPVPELEDVITGAISSNTKSYGYNSRFWYPVKGGISEVVNGFLKGVNNLYMNKEVVIIDQHKKEIEFKDGTKKEFKHLVTTVPLPELSNMLVSIPDKIKEAFSKLKFTSIFVVNLGIKKDDVTDKHWIYYPEDNITFYRVGFPTNFSMDVAPSQKTSLYAEVSYSQEKQIDRDRVILDTIQSLKKIGVIYDEDEIDVCLPIDIKYGYVIYDSNRREAVETIKDYLKRFAVHTIGRYGSWSYMSMEDVILQGRAIAKCLS